MDQLVVVIFGFGCVLIVLPQPWNVGLVTDPMTIYHRICLSDSPKLFHQKWRSTLLYTIKYSYCKIFFDSLALWIAKVSNEDCDFEQDEISFYINCIPILTSTHSALGDLPGEKKCKLLLKKKTKSWKSPRNSSAASADNDSQVNESDNFGMKCKSTHIWLHRLSLFHWIQTGILRYSMCGSLVANQVLYDVNLFNMRSTQSHINKCV